MQTSNNVHWSCRSRSLNHSVSPKGPYFSARYGPFLCQQECELLSTLYNNTTKTFVIVPYLDNTSSRKHKFTPVPRDQGQREKMIKSGQSINVSTPDYAEITIRRPGGETETVKFGGSKTITPALFANIKKQTLAAGRGECLSYRNVLKASSYTVTDADAAVDGSAQIEKMMSKGE